MADKKDEIINLQLDIIRKMTENNIKRLSDDIWGPSRQANQKNSTGSPQKKPASPSSVHTAGADSVKSDKDLIKASDGGDGGSITEEKNDLPPKENIDDLKKELDGYIGPLQR